MPPATWLSSRRGTSSANVSASPRWAASSIRMAAGVSARTWWPVTSPSDTASVQSPTASVHRPPARSIMASRVNVYSTMTAAPSLRARVRTRCM